MQSRAAVAICVTLALAGPVAHAAAPGGASTPVEACKPVSGLVAPCSCLPNGEVFALARCVSKHLPDCRREARKAAGEAASALKMSREQATADRDALRKLQQQSPPPPPAQKWWQHPATPIALGSAVVVLAAVVTGLSLRQ